MEDEKTYTATELRNMIAERMEEVKEELRQAPELSKEWSFLLGRKTKLEFWLLKV